MSVRRLTRCAFLVTRRRRVLVIEVLDSLETAFCWARSCVTA